MVTAPFLLTDGAEFIGIGNSFGTTGGQLFAALGPYPLTFSHPNTGLAGIDGNGLLQQFLIVPPASCAGLPAGSVMVGSA